MDLLPTPEQEEIISSVRAVLADHHTLGEPLGDGLWSAAVGQGWFALGIPEGSGGVGYGLAEEALLHLEIGRAAAPGPFLGTTVAAHLLPDIATTGSQVSLAERDGDALVVMGESPELALLTDEMSVVRVGGLTELPSLDPLVPLHRGQIAETVATGGSRARLTVLVAAQLAGIAAATCEQSVAYSKDRIQFGQPIGGFQAVKHRCADMVVRAEAASAQVCFAALTVDTDAPGSDFAVNAAAVVATSAGVDNAEVNVQNHGGIGFTWEHTAHRYVTRARVLSTLLGGRAGHQARLLDAESPG